METVERVPLRLEPRVTPREDDESERHEEETDRDHELRGASSAGAFRESVVLYGDGDPSTRVGDERATRDPSTRDPGEIDRGDLAAIDEAIERRTGDAEIARRVRHIEIRRSHPRIVLSVSALVYGRVVSRDDGRRRETRSLRLSVYHETTGDDGRRRPTRSPRAERPGEVGPRVVLAH